MFLSNGVQVGIRFAPLSEEEFLLDGRSINITSLRDGELQSENLTKKTRS